MGRRGGLASGRVRRERKKISEYMETLLSLPISDDCFKRELGQMGVPERDMDNRMLLAASLFDKAVKKSDVSAIREIRNIIGDDAQEQENGENARRFSLPASSVAAPFLDVYRDIISRGHCEYVLYGGRGSTKSSFVSMVLLELLQNNPDMHAVACRQGQGYPARQRIFPDHVGGRGAGAG